MSMDEYLGLGFYFQAINGLKEIIDLKDSKQFYNQKK
jgi:hypothetical protein